MDFGVNRLLLQRARFKNFEAVERRMKQEEKEKVPASDLHIARVGYGQVVRQCKANPTATVLDPARYSDYGRQTVAMYSTRCIANQMSWFLQATHLSYSGYKLQLPCSANTSAEDYSFSAGPIPVRK